jgi:hypothetical protein
MSDKNKYIQWFCGFYEGEGWITNDVCNNNKFRIGIAQNDKTPLELGKTIWGGYIKKRTRITNVNSKISVGYEWILSNKESILFINDIKPYMIIPYKINQIELAFEKQKNGLNRRFKCKYCDLDYASPSGRRRHERNFHINSDTSQGLNDLRQDNQIAGNP